MGFFDSNKTKWRKLNQTNPPAAAEYNQLKAPTTAIENQLFRMKGV